MQFFQQKISHFLWEQDLRQQPWPLRYGLQAIRVLTTLIRDFTEGELSLRAMSLVYTTLLSLVPLLAVSFSVLKAFGVHNQLEPTLLRLLEPLGERSIDITARLIGFVENVKVGVLGVLGLAMLLYVVVALVQKIENALNHIWHVKKGRSISQRMSHYLSVVMIAPVLVFSSAGASAAFMNSSIVEKISSIQPLGLLISSVGVLVPYLIIVLAFFFIYMFLPNTRVKPLAALAGALTAGLAWKTMGWVFASFIMSSGQYVAIYSGFAVILLFMIWIYLVWLIVLLGAAIAFYVQNPAYVRAGATQRFSDGFTLEYLALAVMAEVVSTYYADKPSLSREYLINKISAFPDALDSVLDTLIKQGFLERTNQDPVTYIIAKPPEKTLIFDLFKAIRGDVTLKNSKKVATLMQQVDKGTEKALNKTTLADLKE